MHPSGNVTVVWRTAGTPVDRRARLGLNMPLPPDAVRRSPYESEPPGGLPLDTPEPLAGLPYFSARFARLGTAMRTCNENRIRMWDRIAVQSLAVSPSLRSCSPACRVDALWRSRGVRAAGLDRRSRSCPAEGVHHLRRALQVSSSRPRAARSARSRPCPRWDGLSVTAGNTHMNMFIDPPGLPARFGRGVLTPAYEAAYKERWRQQQELGEVQYDRLTHCEPVGYPRWLLEPYSARVRQPAARVVLDQRLWAGDTTRLHWSGAQERVRHALLVWRHDRVLGRQQTRHQHEVSATGRLHALVAHDKQSIRVGRNMGAEAVSGRHRAD